MMASVVEIYHADVITDGAPIGQSAHAQAFAAACAGFLPAFLCLQRLSSGSWAQAMRFTAPWLILVPDAVLTMVTELPWFWALLITLPLGVLAYRAMLRIARDLVPK